MMMFSNFGSPFGDDGLEQIIDGIKSLETNFTVVYVSLLVLQMTLPILD